MVNGILVYFYLYLCVKSDKKYQLDDSTIECLTGIYLQQIRC